MKLTCFIAKAHKRTKIQRHLRKVRSLIFCICIITKVLVEAVGEDRAGEEIPDSEEEEREAKRQKNSSMLGLEMAFQNHVPINEKETHMLELMRETNDRLKKEDVEARNQKKTKKKLKIYI